MSAAASAQSVTLNTGAYTASPGGEFYATPISFPSTPVSLTNLGYFETFCLEHTENFAPGGTYLVDFATYAVGGGGGAVAGQDPLDERTAYLYSFFINGILPGYDYSNGLGQRTANAGALQNVIWFLEGEAVPPPVSAYELFLFAFSAGGIGQGLSGVQVANLHTLDAQGVRTDNQSQLVMFVPGPGAAGLLGLAALGLVRRRR
ncbi:MAG: hypothetical protein ACREJO_09965 [Phycisphaerales bacterium]